MTRPPATGSAFELWVLLAKMIATPGSLGVDFHVVLEHTERWLAGGNYYLARQLDGPYAWQGGESLYPPPVAVFMIPFVFLPQLVWWIVPLGLMACTVVRSAPSVYAWPVIAACLCYPRSLELILYGNPTLWVAGLVAAGTIWAWPAAFAILKPSLGPFALIGVTHRSWWVAMALVVAVSILLLPMWPDYVKAISGAAVGWNEGWAYSLRDVPLVLIPTVAWLTGRYRPDLGRNALRARSAWHRLVRSG